MDTNLIARPATPKSGAVHARPDLTAAPPTAGRRKTGVSLATRTGKAGQ
jgi:hypothetical protein